MVLVVNTASYCSDSGHCRDLEKRYQSDKGKGQIILGFPLDKELLGVLTLAVICADNRRRIPLRTAGLALRLRRLKKLSSSLLSLTR